MLQKPRVKIRMLLHNQPSEMILHEIDELAKPLQIICTDRGNMHLPSQ